MSNPFAAFSIQIGSAGVQAGLPAAEWKGALALKKGESGRFAALDELPGDWWSLAENEPGGYQYRTAVRVLGRRVERMLDGCTWLLGSASAWPVSKAGHVPRRSKRVR